MEVRPGQESDFTHVETFVWQAIFPAFDQPGLSEDQRAENDALVEEARTTVVEALGQEYRGVFVAWDGRRRALLGYVIADRSPRAYAVIEQLIVRRAEWGKGVGERLLRAATDFIGPDRAVQLTVRHYNERAIAFFEKHGFQNTGESAGDQAIPRILMLREAEERSTPTGQPAADLFSPAPVATPTDERPASPLELGHHPPADTPAADTVPVDTPPADTASVDTASPTTSPATEREPSTGIAFSFDFPGVNDEPVFEELPDLSLRSEEAETIAPAGDNALATEELPPVPSSLQDLEETSLSDDQLSELEAFIARARRAKGMEHPRSENSVDNSTPTSAQSATPTPSTPTPPPSAPTPTPTPPTPSPPHFDRSRIEFEIDYGEGQEVTTAAAKATAPPTEDPDPPAATITPVQLTAEVKPERGTEEDDAPREVEVTDDLAERIEVTKACPACGETLPLVVRFCSNCGTPQTKDAAPPPVVPQPDSPAAEVTADPATAEPTAAASTPPEIASERGDADAEEFEVLELVEDPEDIVAPSDTAAAEEQAIAEDTERATAGSPTMPPPTLSDLKFRFREYLYDRIQAYFGPKGSTRFLKRYEVDNDFLQLRDGSLTGLRGWLADGVAPADGEQRIRNTIADLTEYFIVEVCQDIHRGLYPQRLLRHQSVKTTDLDLFRLVMDYLDLENESEKVYTEFISMPPKVLKRVTDNFLHARPDERIFLICDQSLLSNGKNGFAVTDAGLYWKSMLQPPGAVTFTTLSEVRRNGDHLLIDGQFFDAGARLNLKVALLLDRLRRLT